MMLKTACSPTCHIVIIWGEVFELVSGWAVTTFGMAFNSKLVQT